MVIEIRSSLNQVIESQTPSEFPLNLLRLAVKHFDQWSIEDLVREDINLIACVMGISEADTQLLIKALQNLAAGEIVNY